MSLQDLQYQNTLRNYIGHTRFWCKEFTHRILILSNGSAESYAPRGQGSQMPPHGLYCLVLYRTWTHCRCSLTMYFMVRDQPRAPMIDEAQCVGFI